MRNQRIQRPNQGRLHREQSRFTEPLTPRSARHIAGSMAGTEFNPVIRQKKGEIRGSVARTHELGQAYNTLAAQDAQAQQIALQAYQAGQNAATQRINSAAQADNSALQQIAAQDTSTARMLGGPQNTQGIQSMAQGNSALQAQRNTLAQPLTTAGANNVAFMGSRINTAGLAGIRAKGLQRLETLKNKQDLGSLRRERGQAKVTALQKLREQEQNQQTARRAFGLEKAKFGQARQETAFNHRMERNENRRKNEAQGNANQEQANQNRASREQKAGGGLTANERRTARNERREERQERHGAMQTARSIYHQGRPEKGPHGEVTGYGEWHSWEELEGAIRKESEITPSQAAWAVKRLKQKFAQEQRQKQHEKATNSPQGQIHR